MKSRLPLDPIPPKTIASRRRAAAIVLCCSFAILTSGAASRVAPQSSRPVRPPIRSLFGEVAVILTSEERGTLAIGIAGPIRSLSLSIRTTDARRWADSASRLLAPPRAARRDAPDSHIVRRSRAVLEEPGVGAGSLILARTDSGGAQRFSLFADDGELNPIRQALDRDEAMIFVRLVRRAATPSTDRRAPPRAKREPTTAPRRRA